jgi:hypothetical protein
MIPRSGRNWSGPLYFNHRRLANVIWAASTANSEKESQVYQKRMALRRSARAKLTAEEIEALDL